MHRTWWVRRRMTSQLHAQCQPMGEGREGDNRGRGRACLPPPPPHIHAPTHCGPPCPPQGRTAPHLALLFFHLATLGYLPVSREDNPQGNLGCCAEWTLIRVEDPGLGWAGAGSGAQRRAARA